MTDRPILRSDADFVIDRQAIEWWPRAFGETLPTLPAVQPQTPSTMTVEQLLGAARPLMERPQLGRVEVGSDAYALLKARFLAETQPEFRPAGYIPPPESATMYGVPVVTPDGMDPRAWRLLDTDGHVLKEGTL